MIIQAPLRVLIAEDDAAIHEEIKALVIGLGFIVAGEAYNGPQAAALAEQIKPDVILLDIVMPDPDSGREDKQAGIHATKTILEKQPMPIVWLTAYETPQMIAEASKLGVSAYLVKPPQSNEIVRAITLAHARFADMQELRRLNVALHREVAERKRAEEQLRKFSLVIEQSQVSVIITDVSGAIEYVNPKFCQVTGYTPQDVYGKNPRILQANGKLPEEYKELWETILGGYEWRGEFQNKKKDGEPFWEATIISPIKNERNEITHFAAVKEDITGRKLADEKLRLHLAKIEQLQDELREQAIRDALTGLHNRRYMEEAVLREFSRASREEYPLSIIMIDMDKLKYLNDTHGHHIGDLALQTLADCLRSLTRIEDIVCRLGGDEFIIVMNRTEGADAFRRVETWRQYLIDHPILADGITTFPVQLSAGIACFPMHGKNADEVIRNADAALYQAKDGGRNRAVLFG